MKINFLQVLFVLAFELSKSIYNQAFIFTFSRLSSQSDLNLS